MFRPLSCNTVLMTVALRRSDIVVWPVAAIVLLAGCRRADPAASSTIGTGSIAAAPSVSQVLPNPIVIRQGQTTDITIRGAGFDSTNNTVFVGPITAAPVKSSSGGTVILVGLPDRVPSGGGAAPMLWSPGTYTLTVANSRGTSAPVTVTIQEPR